MDAYERLKAARIAAREGRHEEALREFIWFHDHALEETRALAAVRLSYALSFWIELGRAYPPALRALEAIRDQKNEALLQGPPSLDLFFDVLSINQYLENPRATYDLYVALVRAVPDLPRDFGRLALPAILDAKDFALARQISPMPERVIRQQVELLKDDERRMKSAPFSRAPRRWANVRNFVTTVNSELAILHGVGEHSEAARLKALALALIESPSLRRDVQAEFVKLSRPPASKVRWHRKPPRRLIRR